MDWNLAETDDQVRNRLSPDTQQPEPADWATRKRSPHVMCRTSLWGIAGFLGCVYFTWISYFHIARAEYDWPHDLWSAATYLVWIILLAGLALDTHCMRERIFFGALLINFAIGEALTLWTTVAPAQVRIARMLTGLLWGIAAMVSLTTAGRSERSG